MVEDISKKIDLLVDMAGTSNNIDTLKLELSSIETEIARKKDELDLLNNGNNDKYFKASEKQVDENIKVSLELKIRRQKKVITDLQKEIDAKVLEEEKLNSELTSIKEDITASNSYIATLSDRLDSLSDEEIKKNYENIITEETQKMTDLNTKKEELEKTLVELIKKLAELNTIKDDFNKRLNNDINNLEETKINLINPNAYIDIDLKNLDEARIKDLKEEIKSLEKRKIEIITAPEIIASDAKKLIIDDDITSALNKIKELVTIVKRKPFMEYKNGIDLESALNDELENITEERDHFALAIDEKDYNGQSNIALEERIKYLEDEKEKLEDEKESINKKIIALDRNDFKDLKDKLLFNEELLKQTRESLENYDRILNESSDDRSPKRRAILSSAYKRKEKEEELIKNIIKRFKKNQRELIAKIDYMNKEIGKIEVKINEIEDEIKEIKNIIAETVLTKDVLEVESDKQKLKELDNSVKAVKHRKKFKQTPDEIFDEIEIYLGSLGSEENQTELELNYDYDNIENNLSEKSKEKIDSNFYKRVEEELPKLEEVERHKVIEIKNISSKEEQIEEENPFIIGEYKDDEYIDIQDIFNSEV